ncbi:MAG: YkvA family protein [Wenzhouxiangellaceae bacterium]|nr:YkvA family protein [Wenzhouxiangellaceae bacterium]
MSMRIVLELSEQDLKHFRNLARKAMESVKTAEPEQIITGAKTLLEEVEQSSASQFIQERLQQILLWTDMLQDEGWGMQAVGRKRVLAALSYFNQPEDLIPDYLPGIGYLDDAIMIELLARELKPEIDAYQDFVRYRAAEARRLGKEPDSLNRTEFLATREQELLSRMRRRRGAGGGRSRGRSPFSLF